MSHVYCLGCSTLNDAKALVKGRCLPCYRVHTHTEPLRAEIDELERFIKYLCAFYSMRDPGYIKQRYQEESIGLTDA